jgi:large subunit ribosomal protein L17
MRHRVAHRKLGRVTEHRLALLRNQAQALLRHERIETTVPKARELRPFVERLITIAKRSLKDVPSPDAGSKSNGRTLHARRLVEADIQSDVVVSKLFDTIAPRFEGRNGGYTRLLRVGYRRGDRAEVAQVELVGSEYNPNVDKPADETAAPAKTRGMRGRLQAAASRLRGRKSDQAETPAESTEPKKTATPRKRAATRSTKGK